MGESASARKPRHVAVGSGHETVLPNSAPSASPELETFVSDCKEAAELWLDVFRATPFETVKRKRHAELTNRYIADEIFRAQVVEDYLMLTGRSFVDDYRAFQRRREEDLRARTLQPYVDEALELLRHLAETRRGFFSQFGDRRKISIVRERYRTDRHFRQLLDRRYNQLTRHSLRADFPELWRSPSSTSGSYWRDILRRINLARSGSLDESSKDD